MTIEDAFQQAVEAHKSNRLQDAALLYQSILQIQPRHPDANHNMGILAVALGAPYEALPLLKAAVDADPAYPMFWTSYIETLAKTGQIDSARTALEQGIQYCLSREAAAHLGELINTAQHLNTTRLHEESLKNKGTFTQKRKSFARKNKFSNKFEIKSHRNPGRRTQATEPSTAEISSVVNAFESNDTIQTEKLSKDLTSRFPNHPFGWKALGTALFKSGRFDAATQALKRSLELDTSDSETHCNLGIALKALDQLEAAETSCRKAIRLNPARAKSHNALSAVLIDLGRLEEAQASCQEALRIDPTYAAAHSRLGVVLTNFGQYQEAEACHREAIRLNPTYAEAYSNLGFLLGITGRLTEAETCYREAINNDPNSVEALGDLGAVLAKLSRFEEAEEKYRKAIQIKPDFAEAHGNLGAALRNLDRPSEAEACFREALRLDSGNIKWHFSIGLTCPKIIFSMEEIKRFRENYLDTINKLQTEIGTIRNPTKDLPNSIFNLAYHGQDNKDILEGLSAVYRQHCPSINFTSPGVSKLFKRDKGKIKLGICSQFLSAHTISKLMQGVIAKIDRNRFDIVLIHGSTTQEDIVTKSLNAQADKVLRLPSRIEQQQQLISDASLDVLFYPDIGMAPETYFLAHSRLAPVQAVSWGHPDTTGISTLDYFISAQSIEPANADHLYTERLIRFSRLPCYYEPLAAPSVALPRQSLGLPESGRLYGCPQSLFKFHPDFDSILAEILSLDPDGHVVLIEGLQNSWKEKIKKRWSQNYPILCDRVIFLPRQRTEAFMALLFHFDVLLDPIHFGSGNTMYEALVYGTPIITWPGEFMRGRIVAGAYAQMQVQDAPVVTRLEEYARTAVEWARNEQRREAFKRKAVEAARQHLFADAMAVREFEAFFIVAVEAAANGTRLPAGWTPSIQTEH